MPKYVVVVEVNGKLRRKVMRASTPEKAADKAKKWFEKRLDRYE